MTASGSILMFGQDTQLLQTRAWVLERGGYAPGSVATLAALGSAVSDPVWDLLILCHSLSREDLSAALTVTTARAPALRTLVLDAEGTLFAEDDSAWLDVWTGPIGLLARVRLLVDPIPPQLIHERGSIWRSMKAV